MSAIKYPCARCGREDTAERMSYSRWTKQRYCHDTAACERRMAKLERQGAEFDRGFLVAR